MSKCEGKYQIGGIIRSVMVVPRSCSCKERAVYLQPSEDYILRHGGKRYAVLVAEGGNGLRTCTTLLDESGFMEIRFKGRFDCLVDVVMAKTQISATVKKSGNGPNGGWKLCSLVLRVSSCADSERRGCCACATKG